MFCSKCGKELPEGSKFCGGCGEPQSQDTVITQYEDSEFNETNLTRKEIKSVAKQICSRDNVHEKSTFVFGYSIPAGIIVYVFMFAIGAFGLHAVGGGAFLGIIFGLLYSFILLSYVPKLKQAMDNQEVTWGYKFNMRRWLPLFIITIITFIAEGLSKGTSVVNVYAFYLGEPVSHLGLIITILFIIFCPAISVIGYIACTRDYGIVKTFSLGLKLGFKNFIKIWLFSLSFIPLFILIVITCGILAIWKGFYISLAYAIMLEQIIKKYEIN